jgi:hypothetical protein
MAAVMCSDLACGVDEECYAPSKLLDNQFGCRVEYHPTGDKEGCYDRDYIVRCGLTEGEVLCRCQNPSDSQTESECTMSEDLCDAAMGDSDRIDKIKACCGWTVIDE